MASPYYDSQYAYRAPRKDPYVDYSHEYPLSDRQTNVKHLSRRTDGHHYHNRADSPPHIHAEGRHHRTRRWPPQPSVEDERTSLAREYSRSPRSDQFSDDDVPNRGSIEQDPVLIEVENHDRRYVFVPSGSKSRNESERGATEDGTRRKRRPATLDTGLEEPWVLPQRHASPYSFTRNPEKPIVGNIHLSPEEIRAPQAAFPTQPQRSRANSRTDKRSSWGQSGEGYGSRGSRSTDNSDAESKTKGAKFVEKGRRISFRRDGSRERRPYVRNQDVPNDPPQSSRTGSSISRSQEQRFSEDRDSARRTDAADQRASARHEGKQPRSSIGASGAYVGQSNKFEHTRDGLFDGKYSPRSSPRRQRFPPSAHNSPPSPLSSRNSSRASSPTPGAKSRDLPTTAAGLAVAAEALRHHHEHRANTISQPPRPTPLSTSMRQASVGQIPRARSPERMRPAPGPLPYPIDDTNILMPHEGHFQVEAPISDVSNSNHSSQSSYDSFSSATNKTPTSAKPPNQSFIADLPLPPYTFDGPQQARSDAPQQRQQQPRRETRETLINPPKLERQASSSFVPASMPLCPRREWSRKYNDWYTMVGYEGFVVCPDCLDDIIQPSRFQKHFTRAPSRPASVRTRCDFGTPWIRLAWLLTLQRQRTDLDLIYGLHTITTSEAACPGNAPGVGPWYGMVDEQGQFVPNFAICPCDRKQIETLFPSLINIFPRIPPTQSKSAPHRFCALRSTSPRFPRYLDALVTIDETARQSKRQPDLRPLHDLFRKHAHKQECRRDTVLTEWTWHFIPSFPECTVCEECFDEVIWPHVKRGGSPLADAFNKSLYPLPDHAILEKGMPIRSASCQLYSKRMRRVFERAIKHEDFAYLARKIKQRREVEADTFARRGELVRLLERGSGIVEGKEVFVGSQKDVEAVRWQLENIEGEWREWE